MKTPDQRGPIGSWTRDQRLAKGMSPEQVVDQLVRFGVTMKASSYRGVESGARRPGGEALAALERLWGSAAPKPETIGTVDLVAALHAQTEAINRLVAELAERRTQEPSPRAIARALSNLVVSELEGRGVVGPAGESRKRAPRASRSAKAAAQPAGTR